MKLNFNVLSYLIDIIKNQFQSYQDILLLEGNSSEKAENLYFSCYGKGYKLSIILDTNYDESEE